MRVHQIYISYFPSLLFLQQKKKKSQLFTVRSIFQALSNFKIVHVGFTTVFKNKNIYRLNFETGKKK